jgi:threonylcarbamoyladenosine tRNA methylthiotransferase MtaB
MKRRYTSAGFLARCDRLRNALESPAFTTDVIVGFPGETEEDFQATCRVVREVGFAKIHVFSYSPRAGTPAALLPEVVPPAIIEERRQRLRELEKAVAQGYLRRLFGRRLEILVEGADPKRPGHVLGTSCRSVLVSFRGLAAALLRKVVPVRALRAEDGVLVGEPEPGSLPDESRWALPLTVS